MIWRKVYGFIPVPIFYTDKMAPDVGGRFVGAWIEIRERLRADEGIHRHEIEHARQFWTAAIPAAIALGLLYWPLAPGGVLVHSLLYKFVPPYRLWAEVSAYRLQMRYPDREGNLLPLASAAARLRNPRYDLGLSPEDALEALRS